jgi:tetratricopeptide (TPR) repeat protein
MVSWGHKNVVAVFLFLGCFALYGNTVLNGYSIDDETVTRDNPLAVRGLAGIPAIFTSPHFDYGGQRWEYRPLTRATFAVEYAVFGANPHASHLLNVLLYAVTGVVLYRLLAVLCSTGSAVVPLLATAVFLAHPLHTEVVASLKSRDEILSLLFALVSASLFLRTLERPSATTAAAAGAAQLLALMSKLSAVPFIFLTPLVLYFYRPAKLRVAASVAAALLVGTAAYVAVVTAFVGSFGKESTFVEIPLWHERDPFIVLGAVATSLQFYAQKLIAPYPLGFIYGYAVFEPISFLSTRALAVAAAHGALAWYALTGLRRGRIGSFGAAWYIVAIMPFSIVYGLVGERFTYVASVGFALMVAAVFATFLHAESATRRQVATASLVVLLGAYSLLTVDRNRDWYDMQTLCDADLPHLQRSALAHYVCARDLRRTYKPQQPSLERTRRLRHSIDLAEQAIVIYPDYAAAYEHVGAIYQHDLDEPATAFPFLSRASDLEPRDTVAHYDALYCSVLLNRLDDALRFGDRLLGVDPDHVLGLFYVSKLHFQAGDHEKAFAENAHLAGVAPDRDLAYVNYGYFYYLRGDVPRAIENFERALAIAPRNLPVTNDLVAILEERGETDKAQRYAAFAQQLDSNARADQPSQADLPDVR